MSHRRSSLPKSPLKSRSDLRRALIRVSAASSVALLFAGQSAEAAVRTWVGSTSTDWAVLNGFNTIPVSGDSLVFGADGAAGMATTPPDTLTNTLTTTGFNIAGITFNAGAPAYTMTGNTFNLTAGITNNSTALQTFSNTGGLTIGNNATTWTPGTGGISLTTGLIFNGTGVTTTVNGAGNTLTLGSLNLNESSNRIGQTFAGSGNITITGAVSSIQVSTGTSNGSFLVYAGTGTLTLAGTNSFGGTNQGFLTANSGTIVLSGSINSGNPITTGGTGNFTETSTGNIQGAGGLSQGSTGTFTLAGANTYTGATTVNAGTLALTGSINAANATTGSNIVVNGGTFNESSTGVINGSGSGSTAGGQITLNSGAVDLQGANNTTGNITVNGGTLTVDSTGGKTANVLKSNGVTLTIGGGTTNFLLSNNATANAETLYQTVFTTNTSSLVQVTQNGNTGTGGVINLGNTNGFARNAGSIADFGTLPTTGTVLENTASKASSLNGVLASSTTGVAYATVGGGTNFANINASTGVIGTVAPAAGTYGATANVSVTGGDTPASGAGANTLTFAGTSGATLTLTGTNAITAGGILVTPTTTGATTITGGTITAGAGKELVFINNEPNTAGSLTISSIIADSSSGSSALTIGSTLGAAGIAAAPQRTVLTAANTFTGLTSLLNGTLDLSNQLALQSSTFQPNTGTALVFDSSVSGNAFTLGNLQGSGNIALANNATPTAAAVALTIGGNNSSTTYSGILSGAGSLTKTGTGTDILGNANTYTGATLVNGGILSLNSGTAIAKSSSVTVTGTGLLGFQQSAAESSQFATGVVIQGTGGIINEINNGNTAVTLDRANTYTGPTTWGVRGITAAGVASTYDANGNQTSGAFGVNSTVIFLGSVQSELELVGFNNQVGSLAGTAGGGSGVQLRGATLTIGGDNTSTTYTGPITNNFYQGTDQNGTGGAGQAPGGNLIKIGTGTQTLVNTTTANNSYEGTTTIKGGILSINTLGTSGFVDTTVTTTSGSTAATVTSSTGLVVGQGVFDLKSIPNGTIITAINGNNITLSAAPAVSGAQTTANFGFPSGIGLSTNAAANLVLDGGTLQFTGAATTGTTANGNQVNGTTDRLFTIGSTEAAGATGTLDASGTGALNFTNTGAIGYGTTNQPRTLGLTGTSTAANTLAPVIGDNGTGMVSVLKSGVGSWTLTGANTYSGGTTVNAGTLTVGTGGTLGAATGPLAVNNLTTGAGTATVLNLSTAAPTTVGTLSGTLATPSTGTNSATINNGGQLLTVNATTAGTFAGTIAGTGGLTVGGASTQTLTGANTYTGATTINAGTLVAAASTTNKALGGTTSIAINAGTLSLGTANQVNAAAPITMGTATTTGILSVATGANQGSASTVTAGGTPAGTTVQGLGALTLNNTSTLAYNGTATALVFGAFTANNGSVLNVMNYTNGTATADGTNSGGAMDDRLVFSGTAAPVADFAFNGNAAGFNVTEIPLDNGFYEVAFTAVPEPSTWVGGLLGLGALGFQLRRRMGWLSLKQRAS